ncbi:unnamed protein product, partial [Didymodactylos carnosus]
MSSRKRNNTASKTETVLNIDLTNKNTDLKPFPHPFYEGEYGAGCDPKTLV